MTIPLGGIKSTTFYLTIDSSICFSGEYIVSVKIHGQVSKVQQFISDNKKVFRIGVGIIGVLGKRMKE